MKMLAMCCGLCLIASSASAALTKADAKRFDQSAQVINELGDSPDRGIPDDLWNRSHCVVVIPSLKKVAFGFGGEYGSGVMSCRRGTGWTAPVSMRLAKGSLGLQIGAQEVDLVLLVMNRAGVDKLLQDQVSLGVDASIAAGPVGRSSQAATDAQLNAQMLSYSRSHGLFAGIDLSGGVLRPDADANARVYGAKATAREIVDGSAKVTVPVPARAFIAALAGYGQSNRAQR